ncbi:MAG: SpoIIE family protein phosphatase [Verrucomicrobia bacterium]|nr:SpoIIE family protein phosphatase [Verrucomicrobiota bacterium]
MQGNLKCDTESFMAEFDAPGLLNLLADGAYITDRDRQIVFWNQAAQRITGWSSEEVVGRTCYDNILLHVDKDGHALCGHEHCPLHRSIMAGQPSTEPLLVYARHRTGSRIPVEVTVAPLRSRGGAVIGGIEMFRDLSESMQDQLRAQEIQALAVRCVLPADPRVAIEMRYQPRDIVGGDFYRVEPLGADRYGLLVADATGHGVSAALYTLLLRSLWEEHRSDLETPVRFMQVVNQRVQALMREGPHFGTALYAVYDAAQGELRLVRAGHPAPLLFRAHGTVESIGETNPALGIFPNARYRETLLELAVGDALLLYTDGATELFDVGDHELGLEGLQQLVHAQSVAGQSGGFHLDQLEEQLLRFSNEVHLPDDLTLVKLCRLR